MAEASATEFPVFSSESAAREAASVARRVVGAAFDYYPRLRRVKRFVEAHYAEHIPLQRIAGVARLERTYFSAYFHARAGVRYREWLAWMRVTQALRLMHETDLRVTEICYSVGFRDLRTFERAFERCTGECPRLARKNASRASVAELNPNN